MIDTRMRIQDSAASNTTACCSSFKKPKLIGTWVGDSMAGMGEEGCDRMMGDGDGDGEGLRSNQEVASLAITCLLDTGNNLSGPSVASLLPYLTNNQMQLTLLHFFSSILLFLHFLVWLCWGKVGGVTRDSNSDKSLAGANLSVKWWHHPLSPPSTSVHPPLSLSTKSSRRKRFTGKPVTDLRRSLTKSSLRKETTESFFRHAHCVTVNRPIYRLVGYDVNSPRHARGGGVAL